MEVKHKICSLSINHILMWDFSAYIPDRGYTRTAKGTRVKQLISEVNSFFKNKSCQLPG